jgi:hypothetical protein
MPDSHSDTLYDPDIIFHENGPIDPRFMADAIHALMRAMPLDTAESEPVQHRHMSAALTALAATNPRDPIEVMLAVQAVSAYQAACACWRIGMNLRSPARRKHPSHQRRRHRRADIRHHAARDGTPAGETAVRAVNPSAAPGMGRRSIVHDAGLDGTAHPPR